MRNVAAKFNILAIVVIVSVTIGLYVQYIYSRAQVYENAQKVAETAVSGLNEHVGGWRLKKAQVIDDAGDFVGVKRWDDSDILAYLKVLLKENPTFSSIYFVSTDNAMVNASGWKPPPAFDLRKRPWYVAALEKNRLIFTETFLNASQDDLIVTVAKPVRGQDGALRGVIGGDVSVRTLMALVKDKKVGENGSSFLVDGNNRILAHSDFQVDTRSQAPVLADEHPNLSKLAGNSQTGVIQYTLGGKDGFIGYQRIENTDWMLGSFISLEDFIRKEEQLARVLALSLLVSMVIMISVFLLLGRFVIAPLVRLNASVGQIDLAKMSDYRLPVSGSDEFARVARTFNKILDKSGSYLAQINADEAALRRSVEIQTVLRKISEAAVSAITLDELYAIVHQSVEQVLPAKNFYITFLDEASGQLVIQYCVDETHTVPHRRPAGKSPEDYVLKQRRAVYLTPAELALLRESDEVRVNLVNYSMWAGAPLIDSAGTAFGILALFSVTEADLSVQTEDLEVLSIIAAQVSLAIERKRMEAALVDERNLLKTVIDEIPDQIFIKDKRSRFILNNTAHLHVLGAYSQSEVLGKTGFDFRTAEFTAHQLADDRCVMENDQPIHDIEETTLLPSGETNTMLMSKIPLHSAAGEVIGLIGYSRDITERKRLEEELKHQATTDGLSGFFNRRYFLARADEEMQRIHRYGGTCSLLMIDVDHFKQVNDSLGHAVGDNVLQMFTTCCKEVTRNTDLLGRVGGDEFAILLLQTGISEAKLVAGRLCQSIGNTVINQQEGCPVRLSVSIGVAEHRPDEALSELMIRADKALYRAKDEGRNRVVAAE